EPVGAFAVGPRAGGREGPDLAELHEAVGHHVAVDPAGDHGVVGAARQTVDGGRHGAHGRGAGGVAHKVRPLEVEHVRDAPGEDVGQFARHGVLGDVGDDVADV